MTLHQVVVHFPARILKNLDTLAALKKLDREQTIVALVEESLQRNRTRKKILRTMARRQASPDWNKTFKRIEKMRNKTPIVPEAQLDADIRAAITAVRSRSKN